MAVYLSAGNTKLEKTGKASGRKIVAFNIPAQFDFVDAHGVKQNTCPGRGACGGVCYATQGRFLMPNVMRPRLANLEAAQSATFVDDVIAALDASGADTVRIHDSGDFFSQEYLDAWKAIARRRRDVTFYAYTKSLHLSFRGRSSNLRIIQSEGGRYDSKIDKRRPHARIFSTDYQRRKAGYVDGGQTDRAAINGLVQIGLVYHGTRNLTENQREYFGA